MTLVHIVRSVRKMTKLVRFPGAVICLALVFSLMLLNSSVSAQQTTATVVGNVTDTSGAVVVGAVVKLTNTATNTIRTTVTDGAGVYTIPQIPTGTYSLSVEQKGFQTERLDSFVLETSQVARHDFQLASGSVTEVITVEGSAAGAALQTETGSVGEVIGAKQVEDLPLNGRNFVQLAQLIPGV